MYISWLLIGVLLLTGFFGNSIGLIVFAGKRLKKFPTRKLYIALAIFDTIYLTFTVVDLLLRNMEIDLSAMSEFSCKIMNFIYFFFAPISSHVLVILSLNRFLSIQFKTITIINKVRFQVGVIILIIIYNMIVYSPIIAFIKLSKIETSNENKTSSLEKVCKFNRTDIRTYIRLFDYMNATVVPFLFMLILSIMLVYTIFKSRLRMIRMTNSRDKSRLKKDVQFAISSIFLNIFFFIISLPFFVVSIFFKDMTDTIEYLNFLYTFGYCVNFYVLFFFNSIFRKDVLILFRIRKPYLN